VNLFTLGVLWPFLWIPAMLYRPDRGWGLSGPGYITSVASWKAVSRRSNIRRILLRMKSPMNCVL